MRSIGGIFKSWMILSVILMFSLIFRTMITHAVKDDDWEVRIRASDLLKVLFDDALKSVETVDDSFIDATINASTFFSISGDRFLLEQVFNISYLVILLFYSKVACRIASSAGGFIEKYLGNKRTASTIRSQSSCNK